MDDDASGDSDDKDGKEGKDEHQHDVVHEVKDCLVLLV